MKLFTFSLFVIATFAGFVGCGADEAEPEVESPKPISSTVIFNLVTHKTSQQALTDRKKVEESLTTNTHPDDYCKSSDITVVPTPFNENASIVECKASYTTKCVSYLKSGGKIYEAKIEFQTTHTYQFIINWYADTDDAAVTLTGTGVTTFKL